MTLEPRGEIPRGDSISGKLTATQSLTLKQQTDETN